jgi:hypothetical protein
MTDLRLEFMDTKEARNRYTKTKTNTAEKYY